ncbi:hypothetical protein N7U66_06290 [Lacinutrix neustonica]|uniref:Uncharacterized protein n=1 Tax=Lacinutrix neustonica TaxID=2980107 RepID=A0A9E8MZM9_9FLAO|nr:hypothetical protein [Lacinutrix neustonica]WAC03194.1 hypothetical protein N7U66_06290 [Lacinutrix neustonica]
MNSSYSNRTWTTSDGTWNATRARTDQTLNSRAIVIDVRTDSAGSITTPTVTGGIEDLTVSTLQVFTGAPGILNVYVNDVLAGDIPYSSSVQTTTISRH